MVAVSSAKKRLRDMAAEIPDDTTVIHILQLLEPEQNAFADHSIALIGASVVDKALEVAIRSRLKPLNDTEAKRIFSYGSQGPLADISARIKMAYAMGIFGPKTRRDLDHIRLVRNAFAHSLTLIRFDSPEVADICNRLQTPETVTILASVADPKTARGRYIEATVALSHRLKSAIGVSDAQTVMTPLGPMRVRLLP